MDDLHVRFSYRRGGPFPQPCRYGPDRRCPSWTGGGLGHRAGEFPVAETVAAEGLSLPIYPGISDEQLDAVVAAVRAYFG
jgi:dTDP-4-amino-4,6-dideoxygalactose transaminase